MTVLSAKSLRRTYGTHEVLLDADFAIEAGERVAFVGRNGAGKSTLAKILAGVETPDGGEVVRRSGLKVAYLAQEPTLPSGSALDAVLAGRADWRAAMDAYEAATQALTEASGDFEPLLARQSAAGAKVEELGGWDLRHMAEALLGHVGLPDPLADIGPMSGGERRRVALAQILFTEPELAILDEPTNHLDLDTVAWLERWLLERFRGALILVTHDRYLLDRVATRTIEIEGGRAHAYQGGWSTYLEAKAEREAHADRVESNRRNFLRRELEWLRRSPQARSTKQRARVQRVEAIRDQVAPTKVERAKIELEHERSGRTILECEHLAVEVPGRRLVDDLELRLSPGERLALVGPNGCGKTSLLRVLTGQDEPAAGTLTRGKNTQVAFLDQQRGGLTEGKSIFDNVAGSSPQVVLGGEEMDVRTYLERFLFSRHEQRKRVELLSGGERARVALARTLRDGANLVILDEPTNDLDVDTLAALEDALGDYPGTCLIVSHDRWFVDRVATGLLVFEGDGKVVRYEGNYADHLERVEARKAAEAALEQERVDARPKSKGEPARATEAKTKKAGLTYAERKELAGLMSRVEKADAKVAELEAMIAEPSFYERDGEAQREGFAELERAKADAEALTERWAELEEKAGES